MAVRNAQPSWALLLFFGTKQDDRAKGALLFAIGGMWMLNIALFNVSVQTLAPRWVSGRTLAAFKRRSLAPAALEVGCGGTLRSKEASRLLCIHRER